MVKARAEYSEVEFRKHFSTRKGGKSIVMRKAQEIAYRYRKIKGTLNIWDKTF